MAVVIPFLLALIGIVPSAQGAQAPARSQNLTALNTDIAPPWVADPDSRGTWTILYSCIFTLVLCVWTAIHLNVPGPGESQTQQWLRKMKWVITTILAPEFGAFTAWQQWWRAKELCADLKELAIRHSRPAEKQKFSLAYGFFVVMGGLTVDVGDIHENVMRATFTPAGVLSLAEEGHFIDISDQEIQDKSKADVLGKSLVVLQVTWLFLQSISRRAAGLPLTPLEIHTLVHAACALLMFALWFRKPQDVRISNLATTGDDGFRDLIALFLMRSPALGATPFDNLELPKDYVPLPLATLASGSLWFYKRFLRERSPEACYLLFNPDPYDMTAESQFPTESRWNGGTGADADKTKMLYRQYALEAGHPSFSCHHTGEVETRFTLLSGDFFESGIGLSVFLTGHLKSDLRATSANTRRFDLKKLDTAATDTMPVPKPLRRRIQLSPKQSKNVQHWHMIELSLSDKDVLRWERALKGFRKEEINLRDHSFNTNKGFAKYERPERVTQSDGKYRHMEAHYDKSEREAKNYLLCYRAQNIRPADLLRLFSVKAAAGYYVTSIMMFLSAIYGGVHLSLWNYDFPTRSESLMWKISAITLGSLPGFILGVIGVAVVVAIASMPFITLIGLALRPSLEKWRSRFMRRGRNGTDVDVAERQWSRLMAFEAKEDHYPTLAACTSLWLRQELPSVLKTLSIWLSAVLLSPLTLSIVAFPILYVVCRIYIVVESFISLRHVPVGVYVGVGWSKYIPHL